MKNNNKLYNIIWFLLPLWILGCKDKNSNPIKSSGNENKIYTMSAKIDGSPWSLFMIDSNRPMVSVLYDSSDGSCVISGSDQYSTWISIETLTINEGKYKFASHYGIREAAASYYTGSRSYTTDNNFNGFLTIAEYNKTLRTLKGTFYFQAHDTYVNDTISVTDGHFYLKIDN
jgi:hypothetical protein